jgi:ribosomal protein S27AE
MSLAISTDDRLDPFRKNYQECSRCGGKLGLRIESTSSGSQKTSQVCKKCGHSVITAIVNVVKIK